uniref:Carbohydrate (chondroitin 4) sulfotransferase 11 n=1 Tax=Xenopus tropicalis TaxID=8364 RepID=A0A803JAV5_XENTR
MKQALLEVMRMNRICRMVLVTCLGSFVLVIFYFQSMLHPVMHRNPFGMGICCRKGSRSPLQELYNPTQNPGYFHANTEGSKRMLDLCIMNQAP